MSDVPQLEPSASEIEAARAERESLIVGERQRAVARATASAMLSTQLLFFSFVVGAATGPGPLFASEVLLGSMATLVVGLLFAAWGSRRAIEGPALVVLSAREGGRARRLAIFRDYLAIGEEIRLAERVRAASSDGLELHLELEEAGAVVHRSFRGARHLLSRAADALRR